MRKFFGTVLILGGVLSLTDFLILGTLGAQKSLVEGGATVVNSHVFLPFLSAGQDWPNNVTKLCFGIGMLVFGLYLLLLEGDMGRCPLSLVFMINALLLLFALLGAFAAYQNQEKQVWVGICSAVAVLQIVCGLGLLYFASTERPVGTAALSLGSVIYVSSAAVAAVVYLSGKAG